MNKQLVNKEYIIGEKYTDSAGRTLEATVRLKIDAISKTFSIQPTATKQDFVFVNTSQQNWQMWVAVGKAIQSATEFAAEYLEYIQLPEPK